MIRVRYQLCFVMMVIILVIIVSCKKDHPPSIQPLNKGQIVMQFDQRVNGYPLLLDSLMYTNLTGQQYMVDDLQYFISDIKLHDSSGAWYSVTDDQGIHYIDARVPESRSWAPDDPFLSGSYDSISFTFGLNARDNISNRFPNPPERDMFWPEILGGGYHYMKMNLKWRQTGSAASLKPFMFHLGIGQMYNGNSTSPDSIIGYIHNDFMVKLPLPYTIPGTEARQFSIVMNIEKWLDSEYAFDFSRYPNGIMQNQEGMFRACRNGRHAFSIIVPVAR